MIVAACVTVLMSFPCLRPDASIHGKAFAAGSVAADLVFRPRRIVPTPEQRGEPSSDAKK